MTHKKPSIAVLGLRASRPGEIFSECLDNRHDYCPERIKIGKVTYYCECVHHATETLARISDKNSLDTSR